jgi:hypothetical protein
MHDLSEIIINRKTSIWFFSMNQYEWADLE